MNAPISRRSLFHRVAAASLWLLGAPLRTFAADWPKTLFNAATSDDALTQLNAKATQKGDAILLEIPDIADRDDRVTVRVVSQLDATDQITILVDRALRPVAAQFNLSTDIEPDVSIEIKLPGTTEVTALVHAHNTMYSVKHEIKLAADPYTAATPAAPKKGKPSHGNKEKQA
jgi:predicted secreted protein